MNDRLFNDFNPVSAKQWKQKIQFDLKGADYNDTLVWQSNAGISVRPFYHRDDFAELPGVSSTKATTWSICQSIFVANVSKANLKAIDVIERGAESIKFIIPDNTINIETLLQNIDLSSTELHFEPQWLSDAFIKKLNEFLFEQSVKTPTKKNNFIQTDIIGNLARSGNWFNNLKEDYKLFGSIIKITNTFSVDVSLYQNAGANLVQQLAYALAHANEYLNHLDSAILSEAKQSFKIVFNVSVGTNYFFEIAKLRALRRLWYSLASEYHFNTDCYIVAVPTKRNKTLYDYNTNMLRTTTECMSAILGGANTVCNLPYDAIYHKDNEFGERIARNQLLILKHESYLDKVDNPADGSYYIESITNQLADKALNLFKDIEAHGGFLKQLKGGIIQRKIKASTTKEQDQFNSGEETLLGTNKYPNPKDIMKQELELYPFVKTNPRKTLIEPIIEHRLAEKMEQERLKTESP